MEVIRHGNKMRVITCTKCNCQFIFSKKEIIKTIDEVPFSTQYYTEEFVYCPECNEKLIIRRSVK